MLSTAKRCWKIYKSFFPGRTHVLIACFPKSGSTYLRTLISNIHNIETISLTTGADRREQELSIERLVVFHKKNYVAQHHIRYSLVTEKLMKEFNITPIFLVRNIYDTIESLYDHLHKEGIETPMAFIPPDMLNWDKDKARKFIVDMIIPWYFNFYVSWTLCQKKCIITYEQLIENPSQILEKILKFSDISYSDSDIENAIQRATKQYTRQNVGKKGRGEDLPEELKEKIRSLTNYYPGTDFSLIGI